MKINFPDFPDRYLRDENIRSSYVKARAYWVFYLEESNQEHNHDLKSAIVTAATYDIDLDMKPTEYLEMSAQEISDLEGQLHNTTFKDRIQTVRKKIHMQKSKTE